MLCATNGHDQDGGATIRITRVRASRCPDRIIYLAVNVRIFLYAMVTITVHVLSEAMCKRFVLLTPMAVMARSSAVSSVFHLFDGVHLIKLRVRLVSSPPRFIYHIVLRVSATGVIEAVVDARPRYVRV